ncbi:peptidase E [Actinoallomurus purpureus]|uniref:Type 1 glutamine amidotransferase-like domain-containing protein n=1 Tax=Actinoallomurus purpureus TaxID=478114 RepID=UPI0020920822|nr:Type 1 glutamine amidotransferase-like domain-containing protein [Actinoallomurus purpureus]MCO6007632.1 peptidase E [Actinoallomurus purpureus]
MRMYLSSFRVGDHPDRLLALLDGSGPADIAVIANAVDAQPEDERRAGVRREVDALTRLGLRPVELDLREFFDRSQGDIAAALAPFPAVWVRGGNVFMLRHALARSGADTALAALLRDDALVYAGYSAGACVLAPSLRGLEDCDDPRVVPDVYGEPVTWTGLGVLDHAIVPHVDSPGHPETEALTAVAAWYRADGVPHRALRDGQVLVIDSEYARVH